MRLDKEEKRALNIAFKDIDGEAYIFGSRVDEDNLTDEQKIYDDIMGEFG